MEHTTGPGPGPRPRGDRGQVRIGDAEREEVMTALQDHLAAGRLTIDEYEERVGRVLAGRYAEDLNDLLTDLPPTDAQQEQRRDERPPWRDAFPLPMPLLIGLAVLVIIALPGPPFLLLPLLWFGLFLGFARHRSGWANWSAPRAYGWGGSYGGDGPWRGDGPRDWNAPGSWGGPRGWHDHGHRPHGDAGRDDHEDEQSRVV